MGCKAGMTVKPISDSHHNMNRWLILGNDVGRAIKSQLGERLAVRSSL